MKSEIYPSSFFSLQQRPTTSATQHHKPNPHHHHYKTHHQKRKPQIATQQPPPIWDHHTACAEAHSHESWSNASNPPFNIQTTASNQSILSLPPHWRQSCTKYKTNWSESRARGKRLTTLRERERESNK